MATNALICDTVAEKDVKTTASASTEMPDRISSGEYHSCKMLNTTKHVKNVKNATNRKLRQQNDNGRNV